MDSQNPEHIQLILSVTLPSNTPVVGCEIVPRVCFETQPRSLFGDIQRSIRFSWYRECVTCCVHPRKLATVQCIACAKLNLSAKDSYHCSPKCLSDSWQNHVERHHLAAETAANDPANASEQDPIPESCEMWTQIGKSPATLIGENPEVVEGEADDRKWVKIGSSKIYEPTRDDFGLCLRLVTLAIDSSSCAYLCATVISVTKPVINFPARVHRNMIQLGTTQQISSNDFGFSVLSYNILSDIFTNRGAYGHCPKWALVWQYRRKNLLEEIIAYDADILCLQEVQSDHFENFFQPELAKVGYSAAFKKKAGEVCVGNDLFAADGCATFYRHDMFKEIMRDELEYAKAARPLVEVLQPEFQDIVARRLNKDNVALVVILESVERERSENEFPPRICVANTHICAGAHTPDVKLLQITKLVDGLERIAEAKVPILLCGDFNVLPTSNAYAYLSKGRINPLNTREPDPLRLLRFLKLTHSLSLASAYASLAPNTSVEETQLRRMLDCEPIFTNFTPNFLGTLDYIFYTANCFMVEGLLELLDQESLGRGLPSPIWSSDHIAIMAKFRFKLPSSWKESPPHTPSKIWFTEE